MSFIFRDVITNTNKIYISFLNNIIFCYTSSINVIVLVYLYIYDIHVCLSSFLLLEDFNLLFKVITFKPEVECFLDLAALRFSRFFK